MSQAQSACSGIKSNLDTIFGLTVATTVSSGVGTALAGGAVVYGIEKSNKDKKIEDLESLSDVEFYEYVSTKANYDNEAELNKLTKKSKTFGNVRTGLMAGATVTSIMENTDKTREAGGKKEKNLNLASNILAGVTAGTSGASTILSTAAISKAKKDSKVAEECENAL